MVLQSPDEAAAAVDQKGAAASKKKKNKKKSKSSGGTVEWTWKEQVDLVKWTDGMINVSSGDGISYRATNLGLVSHGI